MRATPQSSPAGPVCRSGHGGHDQQSAGGPWGPTYGGQTQATTEDVILAGAVARWALEGSPRTVRATWPGPCARRGRSLAP